MITEKESFRAAKIAYLDIPLEPKYATENGEYESLKGRTLNEILNNEDYRTTPPNSHEKADALLNTLQKENSRCGDWRIMDTFHDPTSGLNITLMKTENNQLVMSFEGSQSLSDWYNNGTLISATTSAQHIQTEQYVKRIMSMEEYKDYKIEFTGHSLGGNNAFHGAVVASRIDVNRISGVMSFDGPGFNLEYLKSNNDEFQKMSDAKIPLKQFKYTVVGAYLNYHPHVESHVVDVLGSTSDSRLLDVFPRHNIDDSELLMDGDNVRRGGEMGFAFRFVNEISTIIDRIIPSFLYEFIGLIYMGSITNDQDRMMLNAWVLYVVIKLYGPIIAAFLITSILIMITPYIFDLVVNMARDLEHLQALLAEYVVEMFNSAAKILKLGLETAKEIRDGIISAVKDLVKIIAKSLSFAHQFAYANSRIFVDTELLRSYVSRVDRITNQIDKLEERLNRIYRSTVSIDFNSWKSLNRSLIMNVGLLSGIDDYKTRFRQTRRYILETAQEFEDTEKMLLKAWG